MPERMDLLPTDPDSVGPYRLEHRLGIGGQGTVYVGATSTGEPVAVKLLHPHLVSNEQARTRFVREMQIAKRVAPYCTAEVLDSGIEGGHAYIVSELVDGPSLQESVRETGPRGGAALERLAINTVTALAAIHRANVVHRDFKPGNVVLGPDGPVVIDFGVARALDLNQSIITSQAVGTPGYMAPEQIMEDETGPEADMFAWGATMVFAATGKRAFRGNSLPAVMQAILHDEPVLDGLQGPLGTIVRECLAKDPSRRPTAADVGDRLRDLPPPAWETEGSALPEPDEPDEPDEPADADLRPASTPASVQDTAPVVLRRRSGRRRSLLIGAAIVAFTAALAGAYTLFPSDGEGRASGTPVAATSSGAPTGTEPPASPSESASGERGPAPATSKAPPEPSGRAPAGSGGRAPRSSEPSGGGGGEEKEAPSGPRTLGAVSPSDATGYCESRGYSGAARQYDGNYSCYGAPGRALVTTTEICRWMYPNHANVKADGNTCVSY
ncbi:protein kinase [Spirillospora sp. NPDC048819]|uniref:serine/threonine-protein kinase n=1 Tax=Spirillospora sp. NPDC048819 TaxID=3155268 RepID=UPI0033DAACFD